MKTAIIIPAYNEEKRIGKTLEEFGNFFVNLKKQKILDFNILVIINNTKDRTEDIVKNYSKKYTEIKYLNFKEGGKGFAITEGFKEALKGDGDLIGFVDADMATPPQAFYDLVTNIKDSDGIIASRWMKESIIKTKQNFLRRFLSRSFNFLIRILFLMNYRDTQCGAKLFKRAVIEKIVYDLNLTQWAFDVNLLYLCSKKRFKIKEYPTIWWDKSESHINVVKTPIQMFSGIIRLRIINSFFEPLLRPVRFIARIAYNFLNKN